jgi:hypothetical protein
MSDFRRDFEDNDDDDFNFDDNDFDFGDEAEAGPTGGDEFSFEDEGEGEFSFGDETDFDIGDDAPELGEVEGEREGGISRPFIIIAALMILLFVGGLIAVVFISSQVSGPSDFDLTATAISIINSTTVAQLNATETQSVISLNLTQTAAAFSPTPSPSPSPTRPPTITPTPPLDQTQIAATSIVLTAQELTRVAGLPTNTPTPPTIDANAVQLTATALAELLAGQGGGPTQEVFTPGTPGTARPTALPDTGLFDDLAAGSANSMSLLALMALALVGVIIVSRRLRTASNR